MGSLNAMKFQSQDNQCKIRYSCGVAEQACFLPLPSMVQVICEKGSFQAISQGFGGLTNCLCGGAPAICKIEA